jgi:hypothetical protein
VEITVEPRDQYQLDGDTVGECTTLVAEIEPGALTVRVPPIQRASPATVESTVDAEAAVDADQKVAATVPARG